MNSSLFQNGTIQHSSWGECNAGGNFYRVVSRRGNYVALQLLGTRIELTNDQKHCALTPQQDTQVGDQLLGEIVEQRWGSYIRFGENRATPWNGNPVYTNAEHAPAVA